MIHEERYRDCVIRVVADETAEDPREMQDHLGTMSCRHDHYDLGDEKAPWDTRKDAERYFEKEGAVWLPLYLMDHSGLTMSTSCSMFRACDSHGWDWGLVGFIWVSKEKALAEYGKKRMTKALRGKVEDILCAEVEIYDTWLQGGFVGYIVEDVEGEMLDSCWGYADLEHCLREARAFADSQPYQEKLPFQFVEGPAA